MAHGVQGQAHAGEVDAAVAREVAQTMQALATPSRVRISSADFVEHDLRDHQVEGPPPPLPPRVRQLLAASRDQIMTGPTCQVADDARFDVNAALHLMMLLLLGFGAAR